MAVCEENAAPCAVWSSEFDGWDHPIAALKRLGKNIPPNIGMSFTMDSRARHTRNRNQHIRRTSLFLESSNNHKIPLRRIPHVRCRTASAPI